MHVEIGQGEEHRQWLLDPEESIEWPLAVKLDDAVRRKARQGDDFLARRRGCGRRCICEVVHADVGAILPTRPASPAEREREDGVAGAPANAAGHAGLKSRGAVADGGEHRAKEAMKEDEKEQRTHRASKLGVVAVDRRRAIEDSRRFVLFFHSTCTYA